MEPFLDKLARQGFVKQLIATIRSWDKRSDKWMLSRQPQLRIALAALMVLMAASMVLIIAWGIEELSSIVVVSYLYGCILLIPNLCFILGAKRSWTFKTANFGIFLTSLAPVVAIFLNCEDYLFFIPVIAILHFIYLTFAWRRFRERTARKVVKFAISMLVMCMVCSVIWDDFVAENLYNDTDDNMFGFLTPGGWVSNWDGNHPVVQVDHIVHTGSMSDPDTIKRGWTVTDLWLLWLGFIAVSVMLSIGLARLPWVPKRFSVP